LALPTDFSVGTALSHIQRFGDVDSHPLTERPDFVGCDFRQAAMPGCIPAPLFGALKLPTGRE
jgi:hypothetical protein